MCSSIISKKKLRKMLRYIALFLTVYLSTQYISDCSNKESSLIIATIAAIAFVIIDMYFPVLCE